MAFALFFLLRGLTARFLARSFGLCATVFGLALVVGITGFAQGDGDRLLAALDLSALAARTTFEFTVREFMHDAAFGSPLTFCCFSHSVPPVVSPQTRSWFSGSCRGLPQVLGRHHSHGSISISVARCSECTLAAFPNEANPRETIMRKCA